MATTKVGKTEVPVHCANTRIIDIDKLIPNPNNPNKHPQNQILLLAKIIKAQGWRNPIVVSNRSGFITKGHGRLQAAFINKFKFVPVDFQDYENEAMEYADMIADNQIAELSSLDFEEIKLYIDENFDGDLSLGTEFDSDILGVTDLFQGDPDAPLKDRGYGEEWTGMPEFSQGDARAYRTIIVHCFNEEAVQKFQKLVGQQLTDKTKFIWIPQAVREKAEEKRYAES